MQPSLVYLLISQLEVPRCRYVFHSMEHINYYSIRNYIGSYWSFLMQYSSIYLFSHSKVSFNSRTEKEIYIFSALSAYRLYPQNTGGNRKRSSKGKDIMKFIDCFFQKNDPFYLTDGANKQLIIKNK